MWERLFGKRERKSPPAQVTPGGLRSRVRGCLLGGALGDALGGPIEFLTLPAIREAFGSEGIREPNANEDGLLEITDDTQMTLFTAEGILRSTTRHAEEAAQREPTGQGWARHHSPDPAVMRNAYVRWLATQERPYRGKREPTSRMPPGEPGWLIGVEQLYAHRSPGKTCLSALRAPLGGSTDRPLNDSKGCGGVMRAAPIGLVPCEDPFAYAVMAAAITHGHPTGYLCGGAYAQIISDLLFNGADEVPRVSLREAVKSAIARLSAERGHEETSRALEAALELTARAGAPSVERLWELGAGWTGDEALAIGVYCAMVSDDFAQCVRLAVNHSGDSDSTGSIAGALAGVQCGEEGLPSEWVARLEARDVISALADDLVVGYRSDAAWRERYPGT